MSPVFYFTALQIALTSAGTVIGAGFASGRELGQFFAAYGRPGLAGLALSALLLAVLSRYAMLLSRHCGLSSHRQLLQLVCGRLLGRLLDIVITLFMFLILSIMLAGGASLGRGLGLHPDAVSSCFLLAAAACTARRGIGGVIKANVFLTPLLIIALLAVSTYSLLYHRTLLPSVSGDPGWLSSSLLYVSYNLILSLVLLTPLAAASSPAAITAGTAAGGLLLLLPAAAITAVLLVHYPYISHYDLPLLYIAAAQPAIHHCLYVALLGMALYTTSATSLYACSSWLTGWGCSPGLSVLLPGILALAGSTLGFGLLLAAALPLFGGCALFFMACLLYRYFFDK